MNTIDAAEAEVRQRWALQPLRLDASLGNVWSGFVLTQPYPVAPDRAAYNGVVKAITALLPESRTPFVAEAFLQMDRIDFRKDTPVVQQYSGILGDYGLGIYPRLPPPSRWTREEVLELFSPQKLRPLANDIMNVDGGPAAVDTIRDLFLGSGAFVQAFCATADTFYARATAIFKPTITDKLMRTFRYHAPLLQRLSVESATTEELDSWSCGAALYMRESVEDNGLLVLRRGPVEGVLRSLVEGTAYPHATFLLG